MKLQLTTGCGIPQIIGCCSVVKCQGKQCFDSMSDMMGQARVGLCRTGQRLLSPERNLLWTMCHKERGNHIEQEYSTNSLVNRNHRNTTVYMVMIVNCTLQTDTSYMDSFFHLSNLSCLMSFYHLIFALYCCDIQISPLEINKVLS